MNPDSNSSATLILVCGLPGSGKTTHAAALENRLNALRLSADDWMSVLGIDLWNETQRGQIEALQGQLAERLLHLGVTVIIEWGTWARSERDALRQQARAAGGAVELHYLTAPLDVLFQRIQNRKMESPPLKLEDLSQWAKIFQAPTAEEMALFDAAYTIDS